MRLFESLHWWFSCSFNYSITCYSSTIKSFKLIWSLYSRKLMCSISLCSVPIMTPIDSIISLVLCVYIFKIWIRWYTNFIVVTHPNDVILVHWPVYYGIILGILLDNFLNGCLRLIWTINRWLNNFSISCIMFIRAIGLIKAFIWFVWTTKCWRYNVIWNIVLVV